MWQDRTPDRHCNSPSSGRGTPRSASSDVPGSPFGTPRSRSEEQGRRKGEASPSPRARVKENNRTPSRPTSKPCPASTNNPGSPFMVQEPGAGTESRSRSRSRSGGRIRSRSRSGGKSRSSSRQEVEDSLSDSSYEVYPKFNPNNNQTMPTADTRSEEEESVNHQKKTKNKKVKSVKISKMQKMKRDKKEETNKKTDRDFYLTRQAEKAKIESKLEVIAEKYHCKKDTCNFQCSVRYHFGAWKHANLEDCTVEKTRKARKQVASPCTNCELTFKTKEELKKHFKSHHRELMHTCHFCFKLFVSRVQLMNHIKLMHNSPMEQVCEECGKTFPTKGYLSRHHKLQHKSMGSEEIRLKYSALCSVKTEHSISEWRILLKAAVKVEVKELGRELSIR